MKNGTFSNTCQFALINSTDAYQIRSETESKQLQLQSTLGKYGDLLLF